LSCLQRGKINIRIDSWGLIAIIINESAILARE
jgi:hypothetical protein